MKNIFTYGILCALIFSGFCSCGKKSKTSGESSRPVIIAYVGGYNGLVDVDKISPNKITHINYAFVDVKDGKAFLTNEATDTTNFRKLRACLNFIELL